MKNEIKKKNKKKYENVELTTIRAQNEKEIL